MPMVHDEAVQEFLVESSEGLDAVDRELLQLETDPDARDRIATVFRSVHTIKGTAGFLGYRKLESVTHAGESLLAILRDGTLRLDRDMASALLALVDAVRGCLRVIEETGQESDGASYPQLIARLVAVAKPQEGKPAAAAPAPEAAPASEPQPASVAMPAAPVVAKPVEAPAPPPPAPAPAPVVAAAPPPPPAPEPAPAPVAAAPASAPIPAAPAPRPAADADHGGGPSAADSNVRVDVGLLDKLMNLVGELVLARNQILQVGAHLESSAFQGASQRLNLITTELQEQVMKTRMQPIGNVWSKLPRVVRDLAISCGKQVRVEMYGKETDLDRTILEAIKDPLTHIIRNAVDHGLETPQVRAAAGKGRTGSLVLRAFHESGQVNIEISDDGAGLNLQRIAQKAVEKKLLSPERVAAMSEYELSQLIFLPGFSTAEKITNVSGRGVGMDVVKTNIERIGGTIDLHSRPGNGTTLKIRIPLTLAIVPALMVVSGGERFAIPQANLIELVHIDADNSAHGIETIRGTQVYRLRGQLLPIVELSRALGTSPPRDRDAGPREMNIIVVQADDRQFGLVVDDVRDTEEIVVKPLGKELKSTSVFAGATIMGDGRVALIIDVAGIAQHAGIGRAVEQKKKSEARAIEGGEAEALLLFGIGGRGTMAIPLSAVARLEELSRDTFEGVPGREVVQYRGKILPLIPLASLDSFDESADPRAPVHVIVYQENDKSVGFVVTKILDVVEDVLTIDPCGARPGVIGSAVVQNKVIDVLDVHGTIRDHAPWFFEGVAA